MYFTLKFDKICFFFFFASNLMCVPLVMELSLYERREIGQTKNAQRRSTAKLLLNCNLSMNTTRRILMLMLIANLI